MALSLAPQIPEEGLVGVGRTLRTLWSMLGHLHGRTCTMRLRCTY